MTTLPLAAPPTFVAIDFETADYGRDSACALALVRVEAGVIVQRACTHEILQCQPSRREPSLATGSSSDNITGPGISTKARGALNPTTSSISAFSMHSQLGNPIAAFQ